MPRATPEGPGKRYPLSSRLTYETHTALKEAAERSGRSISQEAEFRLEQSLLQESASQDDLRKNLVSKAIEGDEDSAAMVRAFTYAIGAALSYSGRHWKDDFYARVAAQSAIDAVRKKSFGAHPLKGFDPEKVDMAQFERVKQAGEFLGRSLVSSQLDHEFAEYVSRMAAGAPPLPEDISLMDLQNIEATLRQDVSEKKRA